MDRPENFPDPNHPLLMAARYNDAEAEDHPLHKVIEKHGLDAAAYMHIAEQRAIRAVMMMSGQDPTKMSRSEVTAIEFSDEQKALLPSLTSVYMDGIFIGWRANQLSEQPDG